MNLWENRDFGVMLLKEESKLIKSNDYIYEIKFDGIRACLFVNKCKLEIISRNKKDITRFFPELESIINQFNKNTIIDGEIISFDKDKISFEAVQKRLHLKSDDKINKLSKDNPVIFVAFDILYLDKDLINLPLEKRKEILSEFEDTDNFIKSKIYEDSSKLFKFVKENKLEGIVAKEKGSTYLINTRSYNWIKIKNYMVNDFYIGGYEEGKNGYLSVKLGEKKGRSLIYVGSASLTKSNKLYDKVKKLKTYKKSKFSNYIEDITYVDVKLSCKVKYIEKTKNNQLRQPIIIRSENETKRI